MAASSWHISSHSGNRKHWERPLAGEAGCGERKEVKEGTERTKKIVCVTILSKFLSTSPSKKEAQPGEFKKSFQHSPIKSKWDFSPRREHRKRSSNFQKQNKQKRYGEQTLIPDAELFIIKMLCQQGVDIIALELRSPPSEIEGLTRS